MDRTGLFGPGINMGFILLGLKLSLIKTSECIASRLVEPIVDLQECLENPSSSQS